jgi:hypothetical protein
MATEPKRYAQRGTKVGEKTKLKYNPTALRDEPTVSRNKSLSFREDLSPKTSTGGSGGSNLIPRNKVDMASGNRNIGSQGSSAKNIVPRGTSQLGPVRPETPSSARTMKDVQGSSRTVNKALTGPAESVASKVGRGATLGRAGTGIGALLYSKNAGEGSDFKGKDRPAPYSGLSKPKGYEIPEDFGMKNPSEDFGDKKEASKTSTAKTSTAKTSTAKTSTAKTSTAKTGTSKGESQSSKDSRMAAYEDWVKTNRDPATVSYLKTGQMKKGGKVAAKPMKAFAKGGSVRSAASRGDGCATKGHTKGAMR